MKRLVGDMSVSHEGAVKKSRKSGEDCGLSNLPESIISRILSCLPTEDAVRTSVLSKDWEFKWTSIYHIKIDNWTSSGVYNKASFVNYVERIILLTHNISSFCLRCRQECDSTRVISWISAVLRRNLENFELHYHATEGLILPHSLLNNTSLRSLKLVFLELPCLFKVPSENCFSNFITLSFFGVEIRNDLSNTDTLTFTFPVLETMELRECRWVNVKLVEINAPALTKFVSWTQDGTQVDDYSINIVGGRPTDFESTGELPENLIFTGSSVARALLNNIEESWDFHLLESGLRVRKMLKGFQCLEDLTLSGWIVMAIALSEKRLALPSYNKLRRLTLDGCTDIGALLELLHAAPYLKSLVLNMCIQPVSCDYGAIESIPYCLLNQLEEVELSGYDFLEVYDYQLENFLLKNGLRLKAFHLRCHHDRKKQILKILELFLSFPKGSNCVTFVIH